MNYLELQTRANLIVDKVNAYEESLKSEKRLESDLINSHKYCDTNCIRPLIKLLLGDTIEKKIDRNLSNNQSLPVYASSAPMWNTKFDFITSDFTSDHHEFINSIDLYNKYNMITLDTKQHQLGERSDRIEQGINYSISSNIQDALVTESQVANVFDWNTTTDEDLLNNTQTVVNQVPGIVLYYLGNGFDGTFSSNIGCNNSKYLNSVEFNTPPTYGIIYQNLPNQTSKLDVLCELKLCNSQRLDPSNEQGDDLGVCCRVFYLGCTYTRGKLESPQQIWQPIRGEKAEDGDYATNGINWQGKALYHELVFKNRRAGTEILDLDFVPGLDDIPDNDPQGLATRLALAKQKDYYINRAWFNELDVENKFDSSLLADEIEKNSIYDSISINTSIITTVGTPTISDDCTVSDITTLNYLTINRGSSIADKTTFVLSFTTPSNVKDGVQYIANGIASGLFINESGLLRFYTTSGNTVTTVEPSTKYKFKIITSDNKVEFFVNDSETATYTYTGSYTTSSIIGLGVNNSSSTITQNFKGEFHLDECSVLDREGEEIKFTNHSESEMTDEQFYKNYKLDYNTYADVFNQSK